MTDKKEVRKIKTDEIEGEYILKNTTGPDKKAIKSYVVPDKKKIIYSTVIWYDPETGKYYFKSESDMGGNTLSGQIVSHKLIQDLLSISKWVLKPLGELWNDDKRTHSGGIDINGAGVKMKNAPYHWSAEAEADLRRALDSVQDDQKKDDDGPKYAGAPYNREEDEDDIRRALKRQDDQKKEKPKTSWLKGTPAQRAEHAKKLAAIKREGCCPTCHRRITPESQSTFDEYYECKWCYQKRHTNCKDNEYSDSAKEDLK